MSSGGSAPPAPDYTGAANATAAGNLANLNAQTAANRPDQVTPWGTSTWTQGPKNADGTSQWTQNLTLTPAEQQALNSQQAISQNQSSLAQTLQGQVASTMKNGFNSPSLSSYMGGVGNVNQNFGGFNPSGVGGVNQHFASGGQNLNTDAQGATSAAGSVNQNTPTFSTADAQNGANAAYHSQVDLLQPQMQQDSTHLDNQLRLQGLTPGTEAYDNAMQNLQRTQGQTLTQASNLAVQTGNNEANQNYASTLAGYNANLGAQGQAYNQGANTFTLGNAALGQQYGQDANSFTTNNTAQQQSYNQALAGYGANQSAQAQSNAAQQQAFTQGIQGYGTAYQSAMNNYLQPLNSMNAVLSGNQVTSPTMPSFATAGYTPGADASGAATATGNYNQGVYNANQAGAASTNSAIAGLGSAAIMAMAMY